VCSINSTSALPPFISLHIPPATLPSQAKCSNYRPIQLLPMSHKDIRLPTPQPYAYRRSAKHLHGTLVPQLFKASNCFPSYTPNRASARSSSNDRLSPAAPDCWACRRLRLLAQLGMVADPSRWRARDSSFPSQQVAVWIQAITRQCLAWRSGVPYGSEDTCLGATWYSFVENIASSGYLGVGRDLIESGA
jgi:hypothetical protein